MKKINEILSVLKIFNEDELNIFSSSIFKYDHNVDDNKIVILNLYINKGLEIEIINKIHNFNNSQNSIKFILNFDFINIDISWLKIYIFDYINNLNNELLKKSLNRQTCKIINNNLEIDYITEFEKENWQSEENKIIDFLNEKYGFKFSKFEYIKNQSYENYIKNHEQEILNKLAIEDNKTNITKPYYKTTYSKRNKNWMNEPITEIKDLNSEFYNYCIKGQIFNIKKEQYKNGANLISYYITDFSSSIVLKKYIANINNFEDDIKVDDWIHASITLQIAHSDPNQYIGKLNDYNKIDPLIVQPIDTNEVKRIEFNLHSKMSSYDGLIDVNSLSKFLKSNKYTKFAITDRYNVQFFPEIIKAFKNSEIQPIFGVEMEVLSSKIDAVINPKNLLISNQEYIIFDIETTGLYPEYDDIIEFGAIKIKNGNLYDKVQFFIKPTVAMSKKTVEITGINESDLINAIDQKTGLLKIVEFFKDSILVAHNGINFDLNFINKKLEQYNLNPISNTLIDTLIISRGINMNFKSHSLESICKKYKIKYDKDEAHRADYDALVLSYVWIELIKKLELENVKYIDEINNAIQNESLFSSTIGNFILVYVKNQSGIKDLYELISKSHTQYLYGRPTINFDEINNYRNNLIIANAPIESDVFNAALSKTNDELIKIIKNYDFITIPSPSGFEHEIYAGNITLENVQKTIKKIIDISLKLNKKVIAVSNSYYLYETDFDFYNLYVNTPILNRKNHRFLKYGIHPKLHFRTTKQMLEEFSFLNDQNLINNIVINNTNEIANWFDNNISPLQTKLFPPQIEGVDDKVKDMVYKNACEIYGKQLPDIVKKRIEKELRSIIENGYAVVYWISHLLVEKSINDGYVVGSRGSVGSSLVATLLNITDVNPLQPHYLCKSCKFSNFDIDLEQYFDGYDLPYIKCPNCSNIMGGEGHNIPFETFLGFNGDKVPDIDLNFSGVYQPYAHKFIGDMFGNNKTFRAGTISTIAEKTSFQNARDYFEKIGKNVSKAEIERYAIKCQDVKRTTGQHPGGIIVVPENMSIFDFTPYNYPADDKTQDWYTTHFSFEDIHDNLLKFDILGHDNPTILKMLKDLTGIDEKDIPNNDPKTMSLFSSLDALNIQPSDILGETTGALSIPEFGTTFVREMLNQTKPKSFSDLIRISGLSHGTDVWLGNAQDLIVNHGFSLNDIIGCRDDIMVYLIQHGIDPLTSFQIMEDVRKGKKINQEHQKILEENKIPEWYIQSCNKIKYMFPKAHATAYVMHAWKFAWYKINYPLEYYASYFSIKPNVFNVKVMCEGYNSIKNEIENINKSLLSSKLKHSVTSKEKELIPLYEIALEMHARGYKFTMIDINKSDGKNFIIDKENKALICPFVTVDGLGEQVSESIINARNERQFTSLQDFKSRTKITKHHLETMTELKIFEKLRDTDQISLFDI